MLITTPLLLYSLQFDPAPRAGEPLVTRRVPDYFLVSRCSSRILEACLLMLSVSYSDLLPSIQVPSTRTASCH